MLKFNLFGSGSAQLHDHALIGFPTQQAGLILCYLLLNRQKPISREMLAAVIWEDRSANTARKYLRNAIWRMKQMIEEAGVDPETVLSITDDFIQMKSNENIWLDLAVFEAAYNNCKTKKPEALSQLEVQALEQAASLYTADLLQGIYTDWILHDRERFRMMYLNIRQKLLLHHSAFERFEEAIQHGEAMLTMDPAREKIHRQMMRLYASNGDRNAAMAQYKRCIQILNEELNLGPMKETRWLYRQIRDNHFDRSQPITENPKPSFPNVIERLQTLQRLANRINAELRTLEKLINHNPLDAE